MTEKHKNTTSNLNLTNEGRSYTGIIIAVVLTSLFFIVAFGAYVLYSNSVKKKVEGEIRLNPGYFTSEMILDIFDAMDSPDEFKFPKIVSHENKSNFLGKDLHQERDLQQIYDAIRSYRQPKQSVIVKDKLEKLYYLYINRAENSERNRNYKRALYYYRKAAKLKPVRQEVLDAIELSQRTLNIIELRKEDERVRPHLSIKLAVESQMSHFEYMYNRELKVSPDTRGELSIELFIDAKGRISRADVLESSLQNKLFVAKMLGFMRMWNFGVYEGQQKDSCVLLRLYFKGKNTITIYVGDICTADAG